MADDLLTRSKNLRRLPPLFEGFLLSLLAVALFQMGGEKGLLCLTFLVPLWVYFKFQPEVGNLGALTFALISTIFFDDLNVFIVAGFFRYWYLLLLLLYAVLIGKAVVGKDLKNSAQLSTIVLLTIFLGLSLLKFIPASMDDRLVILKDWGFYVLLIPALLAGLKSAYRVGRERPFLDHMSVMAVFVALSGLYQVASNFSYGHGGPQILPVEGRPVGFFSETTWYGEFLVFAVLLEAYRLSRRLFIKGTHLRVLLYATGMALSLTRNAFLALAVAGLSNIVLTLSLPILKLRRPRGAPRFFIPLVITALVILVYVAVSQNLISTALGKLSFHEASAMSRLEAFNWSFSRFGEHLFWGHGFGWDSSMITLAGTALGSKSFDFILMIHYIFGLSGTIPLVLALLVFLLRGSANSLIRNSKGARYSVLLMLCFLVISAFAPLHQYGLGMLVVAISFYFSWIGRGARVE